MNMEKSLTVNANASDRVSHQQEIDLFSIIEDLYAYKIWLIGCVSTCLFFAALYTWIATPDYAVRSVIKPALESDLLELKTSQLDGVFEIDEAQAFENLRQAMTSREYRHQFYEENRQELKALNDFYDQTMDEDQNFIMFDERFVVITPGSESDKRQYIDITYHSPSPAIAAEILNRYVAYIMEKAEEDVRVSVESKVAAKLQQLDFDARIMREKYQSSLTLRELQLKEAYGIAKAVDQYKPIFMTSSVVGSEVMPLYMNGAVSIDAEIKAITSRPAEIDSFIPGMAELKMRINEMTGLKIDYDLIRLGIVDERATTPSGQIKPKPLFVLGLSGFIGMVWGSVMALIAAAYGRRNCKAAFKPDHAQHCPVSTR